MSRHRTPRRALMRTIAKWSVALGLVAALAVTIDRAVDRQRADERFAAASAAVEPVDPTTNMFADNTSLLVIGDSFAGGVGDPTISETYPAILGQKFGWSTAVDARGGRAFLPNDLSNVGVPKVVPPVITQLGDDIASYRADWIVVDAGRNDLGQDPSAVLAAMDDYMTRLRAGYPKAKIVIVVPAYLSPVKAATYPILAPGIQAVADKVGAFVIDPYVEGWYRDVDLGPLLWTDGVHPNTKGGQFYAEKLAQGLERFGAVRPRRQT